MVGPTVRTVVMAAIGLGIGWLVVRDPRMTHDSLPGIVLAAILIGSATLAGVVARVDPVRRAAAKYAELYVWRGLRFLAKAAFAACAALVWAIGLRVLLRS